MVRHTEAMFLSLTLRTDPAAAGTVAAATDAAEVPAAAAADAAVPSAAEAAPNPDARDLGYLLHKHPDRVHEQKLAFGTARVFYPEADHDSCTAALWVEVDPVKLSQLSSFRRDSFSLSGYINDRKWAASSLLAVALRRVFSTAMAGTLTSRPALPRQEFALEATIAAVPAAQHEIAALFEPLGWEVRCDSEPDTADTLTPQVTLRGRSTVQALLNQLYVLIPVLDGGKHYWVDESEIAKLLDRAGTWLGTHPQRETIMRRYLAEQRSYVRTARTRLDARATERSEAAAPQGEGTGAPGSDDEHPTPAPLRARRLAAVLDEVRRLRPRTAVDLGCGEGALLGPLLDDPRIARVLGTDVSPDELERARRRLGLDRMPARKADRLELFQSSLGYVDDRIARVDVAVLMEVIEHLDPADLTTAEATVFRHAAPDHVVVTTPNSDYNVLYPELDGLRHPDHRFELTRAGFTTWAERICAEHGYVVDFHGVGDAHPDVGPPTQMAVFSRRFDDALPEDSSTEDALPDDTQTEGAA